VGGIPIENSISLTTAVQILSKAEGIFPHALVSYLPRPPRYQGRELRSILFNSSIISPPSPPHL